jgi:hypothetical protein
MTRDWFLLNLIESTDLNIDCSMFFNWRTSRSICILRFTRWTASMSNSICIWIVLMSWDEYHEMRFFVNRSIKFSCWNLLFISWFACWKSEHNLLNRRIRLTVDLLRLLSKLAWSERDDAMIRCDVLVLETKA